VCGACAGAPAASAEPLTVEGPAPTAAIRIATPDAALPAAASAATVPGSVDAGLDAAVATSARAATSTSSASAPPPVVALDPACRGAALDLDQIIAGGKCDHPVLAKSAFVNMGALRLSATAAPIAPGKTGDVTLTITNTGTAEAIFDVDVSCGDAQAFPLSAFDGAGKRADYVSLASCLKGMSCAHAVARVFLAPKGVAKKRLRYTAVVIQNDAACSEGPAGPLRPGVYRLHVGTPWVDDTKKELAASATLIVK
jgi:hypothetical protein